MLKGTAKLKFDDASLLTMYGEWNVDVGAPINHFYGADGGIDSSVGTQRNITGSCNFVIALTGPEIDFYALQGRPFVISWELGPGRRYKGINAFIANVGLRVNNPQGTVTVPCQLSALELTGPY